MRPDVTICLMFHGLSRWDSAGNDQVNDQEMRQDEKWRKCGGGEKNVSIHFVCGCEGKK